MSTDQCVLAVLVGIFAWAWFRELYESLNCIEIFAYATITLLLLGFAAALIWEFRSKAACERKKRLAFIREIPPILLSAGSELVSLGFDLNTQARIYLPDSIRVRHVHIVGATGSGKTESVILNFINQDVVRGMGTIVLDAKGDASFLHYLKHIVPESRLKVFDLGSATSLAYNPLAVGSAMEAAQRLFSSLTWSEEYYKSKAFSALQKLFETHRASKDRNPRLSDLDLYLEDADRFAAAVGSDRYPAKLAKRDFEDLSGLRDQIRSLCLGHLAVTLSPQDNAGIQLEEAHNGAVLYFRLQSLMSPQLVSILGKLIINHLNFVAGTAHRTDSQDPRRIVPVYLDEFASFACPEFADLISKARSAGMALHFSHQSIGDLADISNGFLSRITDSSATKIVLRINDPDSAEFFARSFGTKLYQKITQRVTNVSDIESAEVVGEGTQREAHQFRASPDLFKSLPTGVGSVLIAHGYDTPHGASTVFKIQFPKLEPKKEQKQEPKNEEEKNV